MRNIQQTNKELKNKIILNKTKFIELDSPKN